MPDPEQTVPRGDYAFEVKWDGFRAVVSTEDGFRVRSRRGWNMAPLIPELAREDVSYRGVAGRRCDPSVRSVRLAGWEASREGAQETAEQTLCRVGCDRQVQRVVA